MSSQSFSQVDGSLSGVEGEKAQEQLVRQATSGDAEAFGALYDHYQPRIYRFVLLRVGRREEAEDITHQVFMSAWENIRRYEERGLPFTSWLYRIARNNVIDYYRTRRDEVGLDTIDPEAFVAHHYPEADAQRAIELVRVHKAIHELKPDYKDVVVMRFVEELSLREVAGALKKSEGAVKLLQYRAIKELKKQLTIKKEESPFTA